MDPALPTEAGAAAALSLSDAVAALSLGVHVSADRGEDSPPPTSDHDRRAAEAGAAVGALLLSTPELVEIATAHVGAGDMLPWALACKPFRAAQVQLRRRRPRWEGDRRIVTKAREFLSPSRAAWVVSEEVKWRGNRRPFTPFTMANRRQHAQDPLHMVWRVEDQRKLCALAAELGQLRSLQALRAGRCDWSRYTFESAAKGGHLEVLRWLRTEGCPWSASTCSAAARGGHLEVLRWLRTEGCPWNESTCSAAARGGHLEILVWAREQGCPWDESTCDAAAGSGHLEVLQWAYEHGCQPDGRGAWTCSAAAGGGHLEVLRWLRESQHSYWDATTCEAAARGGHLAVLRWLREHGCPWDGDTREAAEQGGHPEVLQWAIQHGCPEPRHVHYQPLSDDVLSDGDYPYYDDRFYSFY